MLSFFFFAYDRYYNIIYALNYISTTRRMDTKLFKVNARIQIEEL